MFLDLSHEGHNEKGLWAGYHAWRFYNIQNNVHGVSMYCQLLERILYKYQWLSLSDTRTISDKVLKIIFKN